MYLLVFVSSFSSNISIVGVEYEPMCLVLLARVEGSLLSGWFWRNEKLAWNFFDSFLFLFKTLNLLSKNGTFPLCAIKFDSNVKQFKLTFLCSDCWKFLVDARIDLDKIILICTLLCCSIIPCSLNELLGGFWTKCWDYCPKVLFLGVHSLSFLESMHWDLLFL